MSKNISIKEISRITKHGEIETLKFKKNVNLIVGEPNTGKTVWLKMLDYLLGDTSTVEDAFGSEAPEGENLTEKYISIIGRITINGEEFHLERNWHEKGKKTKIKINDDEIADGEFSSFLLNKLDIPILHYPKGNPYSEQTWPELSWRNLLRHIYRQERFWDDIADKQPEKDQFATISLILGFAQKLFPNEFGELIEKNKKKFRLEAQREQFKELLDNFVKNMTPASDRIIVATQGTLREKISNLESNLKQLKKRREEIIQNGFKTIIGKADNQLIQINDLLTAKYDKQNTLDDIFENLKKTKNRIRELSDLIDKVSNELAKLRRASAAGESLSDLKITHCPACDKKIESEPESQDRCFLCHQSQENNNGEGNRLDFELAQLASELNELKEYREVLDSDLVKYENERLIISEIIKSLDRKIEPVRKRISSLVNEELSAIDSERGKIEEKIDGYKRLLKNVSQKNILESKLDELQKEINKLQTEIGRLGTNVEYNKIASDLEDGMNEYINKLNQGENRWPHGRINFHINDRSFQFYVGDRKWDSISATHKAFFLFAYHYGLLKLSDISQYNYPGLLVIDFPIDLTEKKNRAKNVDTENYLIQPFVDLTREMETSTQVIFSGKSFYIEEANILRLEEVWVDK